MTRKLLAGMMVLMVALAIYGIYYTREYYGLEKEYQLLQQEKDALSKKLEAYQLLRKQIMDRAGDNPEWWKNAFDYTSPEVDKATGEALSKWIGDPYSKIYDWVKDNIRYSYDTPLPILPEDPTGTIKWERDYWRKASETIRDGMGDCEDQAILVASMIMNYWQHEYNKQYAIWVVLIKGPDNAHAFTLIPVQGNKVIILDPAGSQITGLDLWIFRMVEAQDVEEALTNYVQAWKQAGIEYTMIKAVFNNREYRILDKNINEFIQWLKQ